MSKLAAPTKVDVIMHDEASPTRLYITQLVPGHRYASNEELSVNLESFSSCDSQTQGTSYELFSFCNGGGRRNDQYSDASGLSDIQDSDSSDDDMESRAFPPLLLLCDTAGKQR